MKDHSLIELVRACGGDGVDVSFERRGFDIVIVSQNVTEMCSFLSDHRYLHLYRGRQLTIVG
jgi:hypothetical protein